MKISNINSLNLNLLLLSTIVLTACGGDKFDLNKPNIKPNKPLSVEIKTLTLANKPNHSSEYNVTYPTEHEQRELNLAIQETNKIRAEKGLAALKVDPTLAAYAQLRAQELTQLYSHNRPNNASLFAPIQGNVTKAENIAAGQKTSQQVVEGWKNSEGHYKNIINPKLSKIGMGLYILPNTKYKYYWVQIFSGDAGKTAYHFSDDALTTIVPQLKRKIKTNNTGKITLAGAVSSNSTNDPLRKAHQAGQLSHPAFAAGKVYQYKGVEIVLRDPQNAQWSYQTFGEVIDRENKPLAYVNVGTKYIPTDKTTIKARYTGIAQGSYAHHTRVAADMSADINFSAGSGSMKLNIANSKASSNNQAYTRNPNFDFSDNLQWSPKQGQFVGVGTKAAMYGGNAEEIGGQFDRQLDGKAYQGAFAGKKASD